MRGFRSILFLSIAFALVCLNPAEAAQNNLAGAVSSLESGNYQWASDTLSKLLETAPPQQKAEIYKYLGIAHVGLGYDDMALSSFVMALSLDMDTRLDKRFATSKAASLFARARKSVMTKDIAPPSIVLSPLKRAYVGDDFEIEAKVTDDMGVDRVVLYYRPGDSGDFNRLSMEKVVGDTYAAKIPGKEITESGFGFFILADDATSRTPASFASAQSPYVIRVKGGLSAKLEDATIQMELKKYSEARDLLQEVIAGANSPSDPQSMEARKYLGICHHALGQENKAYEQFLAVVALDKSAWLDPRFATPENRSLFEKARDSLRRKDLQEPVISLEPLKLAVADEGFEVGVSVTDDVIVKNVNLYFRKTGKSKFKMKTMSQMLAGRYYAKIPGKYVTEDGLQFYIEADDGSGRAPAMLASPEAPREIAVYQ